METGRHTHDMGSDVPAGTIEMPLYQSHKKVWALQIDKVHADEDGQGIALTFVDKNFAMRAFTSSQLKGKPTPESGWYMVQYEDGYISFSPAKAFEEGYTLQS